jgi:hypothetical protein
MVVNIAVFFLATLFFRIGIFLRFPCRDTIDFRGAQVNTDYCLLTLRHSTLEELEFVMYRKLLGMVTNSRSIHYRQIIVLHVLAPSWAQR